MLGGYIDISFSYDEHLERFSQATRCDLRGNHVHVSSSGFARDFLRTENDADGSVSKRRSWANQNPEPFHTYDVGSTLTRKLKELKIAFTRMYNLMVV